MKFNFRKISALAISTLLVGMTAGVAAAANYPAPLVQSGVGDFAVVYGANAASTDQGQANLIASQLIGLVSGGITTVTGNAASLASGSDLLYLGDELNENILTITKDDLPVALADGTFIDNDGTSYDYEQSISVLAGGVFAFG